MNFKQRKKQIKRTTLLVKDRPDYDELDKTSTSNSRWTKHKLDLRVEYDNYEIKEK